MEGLVNYSSEDEHDEPAYHKKADGPSMNRGERDGNSRIHGRRSSGSYKNEVYERHSSSSHQRDGLRRDDRYGGSSYSRDNKDSREQRSRDSRDTNNGHKRQYDSRDNRSIHDRNSQRYGRDDYDRRERGRNYERYSSRHEISSSSSHNSSRNRFSSGNGNSNYHNSRSRYTYNRNQASSDSRRDDNDRSERYSSTSSRYDHNRQQQQQSSSKYSRSSRRSHTRSRSRSRSKERRSSPAIVKPTQRSAISSEHHEHYTEKSNQASHPSREIAPLMSIPLSETAPKQPNVVAITNSTVGTAPTEATSVIQLPSYYNPSVINPTKYAEQVQKRKLLWGAKKTEDTVAAKWGNAHFSQDADGKVASKFMRLMGIKNAAASAPATSAGSNEDQETVVPDVKSREAMFSNMEQQYEVARQVTHTMRGVGLGFSSSRPY